MPACWVVFPAPLGPRNPNTSPSFTCRVRSSTAVRSPNFLVRFSVSIKCCHGTRVRYPLHGNFEFNSNVESIDAIFLNRLAHKPIFLTVCFMQMVWKTLNLFGHKSQPKVTLSYEIMMNCKCVTCSVQSESACAKPKIAARIEMLQNPDPSKMLGPGMIGRTSTC